MKRNLLLGTFIILLFISLTACGGSGANSEAKSLMNAMASTCNKLADQIEKASKPEELVKAFNDYDKDMTKHDKKLKELHKKYPNFGKNNKVSADFKAAEKKFSEAQKKIEKNLKLDTAKKLMVDPKVQQAAKVLTGGF